MSAPVDLEPQLDSPLVPADWVATHRARVDTTAPNAGPDLQVSVSATGSPGSVLEMRVQAGGLVTPSILVTDATPISRLFEPIVLPAGFSIAQVQARRISGPGGIQIVEERTGALIGTFSASAAEPDVAAVITSAPTPQTAQLGGSATFRVLVQLGTNPVTYEAQVSVNGGANWGILNTTNTVTVTSITADQNGWQYRFRIIEDGQPDQYTVPVALTVGVNATTLTSDLPDVTVAAGNPVTLSAAVAGDNITWRLLRNAVEIATGSGMSATHTVALVDVSDSGDTFQYEFTGADLVTVPTRLATLTVTPPIEPAGLTITDAGITVV